MLDIPESTALPQRFASPGLRRLVLRLGLVSEADLAAAEARAGSRKLLLALCSDKRFDERVLLNRISRELSVEQRDLLVPGAVAVTPEEAAGWMERRFALQHRCLPLSRSDDGFVVAVADPLDLEAIGELEFLLQAEIKTVLAGEGAIVRLINRLLPDPDEDIKALERAAGDGVDLDRVEVADGNEGEEEITESGCESPPVIRLVNKILTDAVNAGASDVHLIPKAQKMEVGFRVDGIMSTPFSIPKKIQPYVTTRIKLLSGMDIAEKRRPQDGRFRVKISERISRDIRVSVVPTPFGEKAALRILRSSLEGVTFNALGFPADIRRQFEDALACTDKIVVVSGPTGSGKTTTLYAAIDYLKTGRNTIITVEDPIEFRIEGLTQIQVDQKLGITFASGLRSILRQDPDVILVGEVRDLETAETSFHAAQTGHLVLTTLHTNDAPSAVVRLADLGVEPYVIAASLRAVLAQRLVRRVCSKCSAPLAETDAHRIAGSYGLRPEGLRCGKGCEDCGNTGYRGRLGVYSLLSVNEEIREAIRNKESVAQIGRLGKLNGMRDLNSLALDLVERGITTIEECERVLGTVEPRSAASVAETPPPTRPALAPAASPEESAPINPVKKTSDRGRKHSVADLAKLLQPDSAAPPSKKVLLVDDDKGVRAVLVHSLVKAGFDVLEACDGEEALRLMAAALPDAIVCDLIMPVMDGKRFLETIRQREEFKGVPFLMLTGSDNEENEVLLIEAGADDFVSKTSSPQVVLSRVRRLLRA